MATFLAERDIQVLSVNTQGDNRDIIDEVVRLSQSSYPVYLDQDREAYRLLGIFVMPAILLIDKDGNIVAGMGYSHNIIDQLKGAVEIMLGEKTAEQVQADLQPKMIDKSSREKSGNRHQNLGMVLLEMGMTDRAISEFKKALELNNSLSQPHIELGCLYVEKNQLILAEVELSKGLELAPDSLRGRTCEGILKMESGHLDDAAKDFKSIQEITPSSHEPHYLLGKVYEAQNMLDKAIVEYKQAYVLLNRRRADIDE